MFVVFQTVIVFCIIWNVATYAAMLGVATMIIMSLPTILIASTLSKVIRAKTAEISDTRIQMMNELLAGIQVQYHHHYEVTNFCVSFK